MVHHGLQKLIQFLGFATSIECQLVTKIIYSKGRLTLVLAGYFRLSTWLSSWLLITFLVGSWFFDNSLILNFQKSTRWENIV
jgi:hypothetical protein